LPYLGRRHYLQILQIPGPTNVPERVLRAMARPTIDHRGPEFGRLCLELLEGIRAIFKTKGSVIIFPASGSGAWESALGLARLAGKVFRIGHLGDFNDLMLAGTLSGVEMGIELAGVPHKKGGVQAAVDVLTQAAKGMTLHAAPALG
jgi:alanine-glyoxylate transaminase/serine-glyoxylate transaminase/serine-pyruvate transaminase